MCESPYDNYSAFEEHEREIEMLRRLLYGGVSHEYGDSEEKLNSPGYEEIGTGIFVPEGDAYDYAMERISQDEDLKQEFVEWFYSDNWVKEE